MLRSDVGEPKIWVLTKKKVPNPVSHDVNISLGVRRKGWGVILTRLHVQWVISKGVPGRFWTPACSYIVERSNYGRRKVVGVKQSCSLVSLAAAVGILQKAYPCVQQSHASGSGAEGGWWIQCSSERSAGSNDWWLSAPWTTCSGNFFTPTLFYLLFLEGKQLRRGVKVHPELLFSPVALESEWRGQMKQPPVKTGTEIIFLSVPGFALFTVSG